MAYKAVIAKIYLREHPNADRLLLGNVLGNQVVVGKGNYKDGDLVIFYPSDGKLSKEYVEANDLNPRFDENGNRVNSGFIEPPKNRVRAQNFRKEKSEGLVMPLTSLLFTGITMSELEGFEEGYQFDEIKGVQICSKYETEATIKAKKLALKKGKKNIEAPTFAKNLDYDQWRYFADKIPVNSLIILSSKIHGTSQRSMNALVSEEVFTNKFIETYYKYIPEFIVKYFKKTIYEYRMIHGTRNVLMDKNKKDGWYSSNAFRWAIADRINLKKGLEIFYEVAGWEDIDKPIMPAVDTEVLKDKEFTEKYGKKMNYTYGCPNGICRAFIYRATISDEDGNIYELPWSKVKSIASELGMEYVPEVLPPFYYTGEKEELKALVESFTDHENMLDNSHIVEGLVIRVESPDGNTYFYKNKSLNFKILEGIVKNDSNYVDIEESN